AFARVMLLGADDAALVARAVSLGAHDCLLVERDLPFLPRVVAGALAQLDLRRENACLRHDLAAQRQPRRSEGPQAPGSVEPNGDTTAHKHSERAVSASEAK
ncbi:MAG TPA: hypothetical protein VFT99_06700, partial [Roseiflexaceae bacterium]|nr:hypothetical protein [Roseiflexaceae bacterium]